MTTCPYGFRVVGSTTEPRRLVDAERAFAAYCADDPTARTDCEAYLSAFCFGDDFRAMADEYGMVDVRGYAGACCSPWLWFDVDRTDLDRALDDARRVGVALDERYQLRDDALLVFFSGSKGFHIGLPTALWGPEPSLSFHRTARRMAESLAAVASVTIDTGVYDKVRLFRAPNSRHPKSGLRKRRLSLDELMGLSVARMVELAAEPLAFDVPIVTVTSDAAKSDWLAATEAIQRQAATVAERRAGGQSKLNQLTLAIIREGAALGTPERVGDRHRLLYSAARNLAECGCPRELAHALLTESGRDSGLPPKDVRRQVDCGIDDHLRGAGTREGVAHG